MVSFCFLRQTLRKHHFFVVFVLGTAEVKDVYRLCCNWLCCNHDNVRITVLVQCVYYPQEVRSLKAKHRPRNHDDHIQYKPAVGRDTNTGPLVATKVVDVCVCVGGWEKCKGC